MLTGTLCFILSACSAAGTVTDGSRDSGEEMTSVSVDQGLSADGNQETGESEMKENVSKEATEALPQETATPQPTPSAEEIYAEMVELSLKFWK